MMDYMNANLCDVPQYEARGRWDDMLITFLSFIVCC